MKCSTDCQKYETCLVLCDEAKRYVDPDRPSKELTNEELIDFVMFVLHKVGLSIPRTLQAARMLALIPKSTAHLRLIRAKQTGPGLVDYFMSNRGLSYQEILGG